ncbi:UPF0175 family protein [Coleofasciculus sp. FACHB-T130]|uniref:UPF0175 family protein n=1 Tax=Cyanophyceae TaxID=3028117 RepID=UPI00168439C2|nr:UPF0175 family protein [Coleofasciculus sp. FACHB-T130]MBD1880740.1 UPF0175 family protein [Coleofasciculus sp. FACHB-T130]
MTASKIEVKFTAAVPKVSEEHLAQARCKAHEAFVMELLRQSNISAERAAKLLDIDRWQLAELMFVYDISPFDDMIAKEELQREIAYL